MPHKAEGVGDHIRRRRYELGLTQKEVARRIGVSADTVKNWEAGRTEPGVPYGPRIVDFLGYFPRSVPPDFPAQLTLLRWRLGLTQAALAIRIGVDESTVREWEKGNHRPIRRHRKRMEALLSSLDAASEGEPVP